MIKKIHLSMCFLEKTSQHLTESR